MIFAKTTILILLATLALVTTIPHGTVPGARANPFSSSFYGHAFSGWGFTLADIRSPGPEIMVRPSEAVTLNLFAADGPVGHNFGVDYNGNQFADAGEPFTGTTFNSRTAAFRYDFVATSVEGTYTYFCYIHPVIMFGSFVVRANHDVAVTGISASRNFAYSGVSAEPIKVDVTVANQGQTSETFTVAAKADTVVIGSRSVTLAAGTSTTESFTWDASLLARGTYLLSAEASQVTGEIDLADNTVTGGVFTVRLRGDATNDCTVNILDLVTVATAFGSTPSSTNWNAEADLNNDLLVNLLDLLNVALSFGQTCA